jgi:hypothetical protein
MELAIAAVIAVALAWWIGRRQRLTRTQAQVTIVRDDAPRLPRARTERSQQFEVVGESHRQAVLERLCAPRTEKEANVPCRATLVLERENPVDADAVRVEINGELVGYLSRKAAQDFQPIARVLASQDRPLVCDATIVGGWKRSAADWGYYGVVLDLPPADELLRQVEAGRA